MAANLAALKQRAATLGATVECDSSGTWEVYQIIAPHGKVWACDGSIHMLRVEWRRGEPGYREEAIADAINRMDYGVADCQDGDCEFCEGETHD